MIDISCYHCFTGNVLVISLKNAASGDHVFSMNPVRWKYLAAIFLAVSVVFLTSDIVLPQWKSPQKAVYYGPLSGYAPDGSTISGYYIPTVDNGSTVRISIYNFIPGSLDISVFPSENGGIAPSGTPVYTKTPSINSSFYFRAGATQPYGMYIISRNFTKFTLIVEATYSPYFWVSNYTSLAIIAVLGSFVLLYYYTFTSKRWILEQKAIREARGEEE